MWARDELTEKLIGKLPREWPHSLGSIPPSLPVRLGVLIGSRFLVRGDLVSGSQPGWPTVSGVRIPAVHHSGPLRFRSFRSQRPGDVDAGGCERARLSMTQLNCHDGADSAWPVSGVCRSRVGGARLSATRPGLVCGARWALLVGESSRARFGIAEGVVWDSMRRRERLSSGPSDVWGPHRVPRTEIVERIRQA